MTPSNGHNNSKAQWAHMKQPLIEVDPLITAFARNHGLKQSKNYHDCPERSLKWGRGVRRLIQVYLEREEPLRFRVWLCASQDRWLKRYWKQENLRVGLTPEELKAELPQLLENALEKVNSWDKSCLEFATNIWPLK